VQPPSHVRTAPFCPGCLVCLHTASSVRASVVRSSCLALVGRCCRLSLYGVAAKGCLVSSNTSAVPPTTQTLSFARGLLHTTIGRGEFPATPAPVLVCLASSLCRRARNCSFRPSHPHSPPRSSPHTFPAPGTGRLRRGSAVVASRAAVKGQARQALQLLSQGQDQDQLSIRPKPKKPSQARFRHLGSLHPSTTLPVPNTTVFPFFCAHKTKLDAPWLVR
jgi:hypothetical protein